LARAMRNLEIGVCSWSLKATSIPELEKLLGEVGASSVQLALGDPNHASWKEGDRLVEAAKKASFEITAAMIGFPGEDYTTPETIRRTGGFGDPARRRERLDIFRWAVDRTVELGVEILSTHAGFIPEPEDPERGGFIDCLGEAVDYAASHDLLLALETGQETPDLLRRTIDEMDSPNLKVNFDPANIILYNMGDPIRAIEVFANDIVHVHVKDAIAPAAPGQWGTEVPLGAGEVGIKEYVEELVRLGYDGPLVVEREVGDQRGRVRDIAAGIRLLKKILAGG
jgi:L-ribulose-5-phosphate 3-epimerase